LFFFLRALLDAKKQRLCRHLSSASALSSTTINPFVARSVQDQVHNSTAVGDQSSSSPPPPPPLPSSIPTSSSVALEVIMKKNII